MIKTFGVIDVRFSPAVEIANILSTINNETYFYILFLFPSEYAAKDV